MASTAGVRCACQANALVLDPFAGVATTAVACKQLGRRFLGCEINAEWYAAGVRRVEAAREQLRLARASAGGEQVARW